MSEQSQQTPGDGDDPKVMVIGPDGMAMSAPAGAADEEDDDGQRHITELVEQPAKVMRIGSMIRQLLEEVKSAPLDEASRNRLLELREELERITLPFTEGETPTDAELRIAQAQLVGWLEGVFHGIQTALFAQQMAARAQLEQMRRGLPPGASPQQQAPEGLGRGTGQYL